MVEAIKKALEGVTSAFNRVLAEAPADADHFSIGFDCQGKAIRIDLADMRTITELLTTLEALQLENAELRKALEWYGEQARLARLIHSEGDAGRNSLSQDGGLRARQALASSGEEHHAE